MSSPEAPVSGEGPTIPIRTSSIVTSADNIAKIALDINRRRLATTASREQLKRKRSSESVSSDVVKQARIEAELLDVEWDEAKITREEVSSLHV
jgi:predicted metal-dependent RNase